MYIETNANTNTNDDKYLGEIERVEARPVSVVEQVQVGLDLIVLLFGFEIIVVLLFGFEIIFVACHYKYSSDATVII